MADYDLKSNLKAAAAIAQASPTTDQTSAALDVTTAPYGIPYGSITAAIYVGVGGITFDTTNRIDFEMTHSDDDSTYVAVTDDEVILDHGQTVAALSAASPGSGVAGTVKSLVAAHASADISLIGYRGKKRYVKIKADFSGTHGSGTPMHIDWLLGVKAMPQDQSAWEV